jgi:hypothetical protein
MDDQQHNIVELSTIENKILIENVVPLLVPVETNLPIEQVLPIEQAALEPIEQVLSIEQVALETIEQVLSIEQVALEPMEQVLLEPIEQVALEPIEQVLSIEQSPLKPMEQVLHIEQVALEPIEQVLSIEQVALERIEQVLPIEQVLSIEKVLLKPIENPILDEINLQNSITFPNSDMVTIDINKTEDNTLETINKLANDQDTMQRMNVSIQVLLEMYRVITSSLLILFVPQICDDHICSTTENLVWETSTYNTALCFNFISMAFLANMYYLELVRENRLIKYLSINTNLANDNEEVGKQLQLLSSTKQNKIFNINKNYKISAYIALGIYVLNVMLSAAAVNKYYAGSQTTSTFVTYVLFIATKFASVKTIISTDKNIFYSAYILSKVQFNDVDPDCITKS